MRPSPTFLGSCCVASRFPSLYGSYRTARWIWPGVCAAGAPRPVAATTAGLLMSVARWRSGYGIPDDPGGVGIDVPAVRCREPDRTEPLTSAAVVQRPFVAGTNPESERAGGHPRPLRIRGLRGGIRARHGCAAPRYASTRVHRVVAAGELAAVASDRPGDHLAVIRPSRIVVSWPTSATSMAAIPLGQSRGLAPCGGCPQPSEEAAVWMRRTCRSH
jgi:hypothetical protein